MYYDTLQSPAGMVEIVASDEGVLRVTFVDRTARPNLVNRHTETCKRQLEEYFFAGRREFDVPLVRQGTPFQQRIWDSLRNIAFGRVLSYRDIAESIANPKAVRAVGAANGANPVGIIVPCHRVIGRDGTLTGYAGGLERKRWLLQHEGVAVDDRGRLVTTAAKDDRQGMLFS